MTNTAHKIYLTTLSSIVVLVTIYLFYYGSSYYFTSMEERFYHPDHQSLKPNGLFGHGLGIIGTLLILIGVFGYMARKRFKSLARIGMLKHWLEFHIFLCTLGPIMVLFHTSFKFGGIVSVSFWSMVAVVASGVIGRFIYLQIPRTIQGRELSLHEVHEMKQNLTNKLKQNLDSVSVNVDELIGDTLSESSAVQFKGISGFAKQYWNDLRNIKQLKNRLKSKNLNQNNINAIINLVKTELAMTRKIQRLVTMQQLFRYWHIAHLPFALIMLIIMIVHVAVSVTFGYTWIF